MKKERIIGLPPLSRGKKIWIMAALSIAIFFNNGDSTLISTASVGIISAIGGAELYALIFTVKMISTTIIMAMCGKIVDKLGRRNTLLWGIGLVGITYIGSGLATSMPILIAWRLLAGVGAGFMFGTTLTMLGEMAATSANRGLTYMVNVIAGGVAMVVSPLIAAWTVSNLTWSWAFWLFAPLALISFVIIFVACPNYRFEEEGTKTDKLGIVLVTLSLSILVTIIALAGTYVSWSSPITIIGLVAGVALLIWFIRHESKTDESVAILPVQMLKSKVVIGCAVGQITMTINSVCLLSYVAYYMQMAMGVTATQAGLTSSLNYGICTVGGVIILALMTKTQNFRFFGRFTVIGEAVALILVYIFLSPAMSILLMYVLISFYGIMASVEGYAFIMTNQLAVSRSRMAVGTTVIAFMQSLGGVVGMTIAGAIVNNSTDFASGVRNVYLFAAILTVVGAIVYVICVPKTEEIKEIGRKAQEAEDAAIAAAQKL